MLPLLLAGAAVAGPKSAASVVSIKGRVWVEGRRVVPPGRLTRGTPLYEGDIVRTGANSKATLLLSGGVHHLNANTTIEITAAVPARRGNRGFLSFIRVVVGEIWSRIVPGQAVRTASATLGPAGTEFNVQVAADGTTTVTVLEGEVDFFNPFGAVVVGESQQSTARPGTAPTAPVTIANPGLIIEWMLDLERAAIPRERFFISLDRRNVSGELMRGAERVRRSANDAAARRGYGDALFDSGRFAEALREYREAERLVSRQPETLTRMGYVNLELGNLDAAETAFHAALAVQPEHVPALVGQSVLELTRDQPLKAQALAERAVALEAISAEAQLSLGLALLRQPGKLDLAVRAFRSALAARPAAYHYQARAWLALAYLAQDDREAALREAQAATLMAPDSGLAHGNLALVYFFTGRAREAVREAQVAMRLNPNAVAARVALGQALLAQGDVDEAARAAAYAVALDPKLPQAQYLLGIADAQRRDYPHAMRALQAALRLAPDFLPAASALARVYNRMGRNREAVALLTELQARQGDSDAVQAALGEVYYEQGRYTEAIAQYERAIRLKPNSALHYAGLARLSLDANRLNEAINAGQKAVQLAPAVGQYHAILALAYDYSRLGVQAEREYRSALALDPQNALALVQLGLRNVEGDPRTAQRTTGLSFVQGFVQEPLIARDLLRGGIKTEFEPRVGEENRGATLNHRDVARDGRLHFFGRLNHDRDNGDRANADDKTLLARQDTTYLLNPRTNLYFHLLHRRDERGLPGSQINPVVDDRASFRFYEGILAARHRLGGKGYLWAGFFTNAQHHDRINPDRDASFARHIKSALEFDVLVASRHNTDRAKDPELRLDLSVGQASDTPGVLSFGIARPHTRSRQAEDLFGQQLDPNLSNSGNLLVQQDARTRLAYMQLTQRLNQRLSFIGQLRHQRVSKVLTQTGQFSILNLTASSQESKSYWLPSLAANYQVDQRTALRLLASRRVTDITSSIFAPTATLLTTEGQTLPTGLADPARNGDLSSVELDAERYLSAGGILKLILFHTTGHNLSYDFSAYSNPNLFGQRVVSNSLNLNRVQRTGLGVRYEQPVRRNLFTHAMLSLNRTTNDTVGMPFSGRIAPYHPRIAAEMGVNYVDPAGNKIGLFLNYKGAFFQDTGDLTAVSRPRFPARTTLDLMLAREPSLHNEVFLQITNVFNARQIIFNNIPIGQRRLRVGMTRRF